MNVIAAVSITEAFRPLLTNSVQVPPRIWFLQTALNMLIVQWAQRERENNSGIRVVSICPGYNATNLNNYAGTMSPADGCKVIVKAALEREGKSGVFIHKDGEYPW
ncbi:short chain oxidoreductase [Mycena sanguinolenta]|nr:short chain oxidoreductase [Mycena sanguinolenta]